MTENDAREEICRVGRSLFERGYVHASAGNISVRLGEEDENGLLITPTDACLGLLDPARLARLDAHGVQLSGDKASKTIKLHRRIYEAARQFDADTSCVIHTHSTHCVAPSLQSDRDELLDAITPYFVMKVGHVPLISYHAPGSDASADAVVEQIVARGRKNVPIRAVMLARLGPNVWHNSPAAAMATLEELEETAKLRVLSGDPLAPLEAIEIEELRRLFGARW